MVEPSAASSGEMGGEDAVVGSGGVAGSVAGVAFGVERRSLSGFLLRSKFRGGLDCRRSRFGWRSCSCQWWRMKSTRWVR